MGWLFTQGFSKADQVAALVKGWEKDGTGTKILAHSLRGSTLYMVGQPYEVGKPESIDDRWIVVCLLRSDRNYGYGYKDISESMGPNEYDCPLKFLAMVPWVRSLVWRNSVRAHHALKKAKAATPLKVGARVTFKPGLTCAGSSMASDTGIISAKRGRGWIVEIGMASVKVYARHIATVEYPDYEEERARA